MPKVGSSFPEIGERPTVSSGPQTYYPTRSRRKSIENNNTISTVTLAQNVIPETEFAYKSENSTTLLRIKDNITTGFLNRKIPQLYSSTLKKAFDPVLLTGLINKLMKANATDAFIH